MSSTVQIVPYTQTTTNVITYFTVETRQLVLFETASFNVNTYDANNNLVSRQVISLTNQQYLEWQNQDSYITNLVAQELGFTIAPTS